MRCARIVLVSIVLAVVCTFSFVTWRGDGHAEQPQQQQVQQQSEPPQIPESVSTAVSTNTNHLKLLTSAPPSPTATVTTSWPRSVQLHSSSPPTLAALHHHRHQPCQRLRIDGSSDCLKPCTTTGVISASATSSDPIVTPDFPCFEGCRCPAPFCMLWNNSSSSIKEDNVSLCVESPFFVHDNNNNKNASAANSRQRIEENELVCASTSSSSPESNSNGLSDQIPPFLPIPVTSNLTREDLLPVETHHHYQQHHQQQQQNSHNIPLVVPSSDALRIARAQLQRFKRATSWGFKRWFDWGEGVPYGGARRHWQQGRQAQKQEQQQPHLPTFAAPRDAGIMTGGHGKDDGIYRWRNVCIYSEGKPAGFDASHEKFRGVSELDPLARHASRFMRKYVAEVQSLKEPPSAVLDMRVLLIDLSWKSSNPGHFFYRALAARNIAEKAFGGGRHIMSAYHVIFVANPHAGESDILGGARYFYQLLGNSWSIVYSDTPTVAERRSHFAQRFVEDFFGGNDALAEQWVKRKLAAEAAAAATTKPNNSTANTTSGDDNKNNDELIDVDDSVRDKQQQQQEQQLHSLASDSSSNNNYNHPFNDYTPQQLQREFSATARMRYDSLRSHKRSRHLKYKHVIPFVCFKEVVIAHVCDSACHFPRSERPGNRYFFPYVGVAPTTRDAVVLYKFKRAMAECLGIKLRKKTAADGEMVVVTMLARTKSRVDIGLASAVPQVAAVLEQLQQHTSSRLRLQVVSQADLSPASFLTAMANSDVVLGTMGASLIFSFMMPPGGAVVEITGVKSCSYGKLAWDSATDCEFGSIAFANGQSHLVVTLPRSSTIGAWSGSQVQQFPADAAFVGDEDVDEQEQHKQRQLEHERQQKLSATFVGAKLYRQLTVVAVCRVYEMNNNNKNNKNSEVCRSDDHEMRWNASRLEFQEVFVGADS